MKVSFCLLAAVLAIVGLVLAGEAPPWKVASTAESQGDAVPLFLLEETPSPSTTPSAEPTIEPGQPAEPPSYNWVEETPTAAPLEVTETELLSATATEPEAAASEAPAALALPARMRIPRIGINARVIVLGLSSDGIMDVPTNAYDVAWYDFSALPGQPGNAVFAGHRDWSGALGSFYDLPRLGEGDEIVIYGDVGAVYRYTVEWSRLYGDDDAPVGDLLGNTEEATATLVTCEGWFNYSTRNYVERRVVRARLVD